MTPWRRAIYLYRMHHGAGCWAHNAASMAQWWRYARWMADNA